MKATSEVAAYLGQHPKLHDALEALNVQVNNVFGKTELRLEMFKDPEDCDSTGKLFALIPTPLTAKEATPLLGRLDNEWWLDQPAEIHRLMSVDMQYVEPTR